MRLAISLVLLSAGLSCMPASIESWLSLDRDAVAAGEIWRLWTGHLLHFSAAHAVVDIGMFFVVTVLAEREMGPRLTGAILMLGAPLISLALLAVAPNLDVYEGSSALAYLLGVAGSALLWRRAPRMRRAIEIAGFGVICKTCLDATGSWPQFSSLPEGVHVAWQAHVIAGILGTLVIAAGRASAGGAWK